ncbi:STAS domain-containing protein [Actinomadura sp. NPDC049753]|uniref:STAS domain-containing protein n=1 Tax=Actinomadura sp. NPDC049753 TaxID=3154739 RepID=UPI00343087B3
MTTESLQEPPRESPAGPRLGIEVGAQGTWLVVELRGELDLFTAPALADRVEALIRQPSSPRIALQVSQVGFCDSAGINTFVRLWKRAGAAGRELVLLRPHPRVAQVLAMTALDHYLPVHDTLPA